MLIPIYTSWGVQVRSTLNVFEDMFIVYKITFMFKNIRKNWITVASQQLSFKKDEVSYVATFVIYHKFMNNYFTSFRLLFTSFQLLLT